MGLGCAGQNRATCASLDITSPEKHRALKGLEFSSLSIGEFMFFPLLEQELVKQSEIMLKGRFGQKWEQWHAKTERIV